MMAWDEGAGKKDSWGDFTSPLVGEDAKTYGLDALAAKS